MRILVAPQEFKGSLTAVEAAAAMAEGAVRSLTVVRASSGVDIDRLPVADGGPGTVAAIVSATVGELRRAGCRDPFGRPIDAAFGLIDGGRTAVIEMAAAAGLVLLRTDERDPLRATTEGAGDLIRAALDAGVTRIIVGMGGSATNDGGAGMARALGVRLLDSDGNELPPGGAALAGLARIDVSGLDPRLRDMTVTGATDVRNPLCGPEGASAVFGPQKGAAPADVERLDEALRHFAAVVQRDLGRDVADIPGAGAAGGFGAGMLAFLGATLRSGFELVAEVTGLERRIAGASLVLTGEGRLDAQSVFGKTTVGVARLARQHGVPCVALCGGLGDGWERGLDEGLTAAFSIAPGPLTLDDMQRRARELLAGMTEQAVRLFLSSRPWQHSPRSAATIRDHPTITAESESVTG